MTTGDRSAENLTVTEFRESDGMADWPVLEGGAATFFRTASIAESAALVQAIARIEGIEAHRPRIDVRAGGITVSLVTETDEWFGMSSRDVEVARLIAAAAAGLGLRPDPSAVQSVGPIVIGAEDIEKVRPFWQALTGYEPRPDSPEEDLIDPARRSPGIWFEKVDGHRAERNRMHVAVWVPYDQAEARVAAAIAAGGTLIYGARAPAWWTLADPEGNEADVATSMSR